jgi:phage tail sheath protein FI
MEYHTPGVYIREVDSGPKPITSVATSIPGFLGLFQFKPPTDAVAISGSDGAKTVTGKVIPQLVDEQGKIEATKADDAVTALTQAFKLKTGQVRNLSKLMELNGHKPTFGAGAKGMTKITAGKESVEVSAEVVDTKGAILTDSDLAVEELLNNVGATFPLDKPKPKTAKDLLEVYGFEFQGAKGTAMLSEYSVAPFAVTNKSEFFRWLQSFFAQYLVETRSIEELVGEKIDDPDEAADAVFEALANDDNLKTQFREFLSQPSVFNFVASVNGFYDNGGGKCYVYLLGVQDLDCSIRENQADKVGLYAFDDCDDMALHVATGLNNNQQREMLEHCETRKDRFAILDGPIVSAGDMDIPASNKGYGAMYVPWVKVTKPSWYVGQQDINVRGPLRRKLMKTEKNELYLPPSGHVAGLYARVDTERGVHKAPANEILMGITGLTQKINALEQGQYNDRGINVIRIFKDRGIRVWGARTLATKSDPSWKYINVRRLFIMIEQSLINGMQWAVFEPNDRTLWAKLNRDVRSYLMRVWRSGALFGKTPEEAFYVKCDEETNPRYLIDAGQVNVQVGICPVKPAEFVIFSIGQWDGGAAIEE